MFDNQKSTDILICKNGELPDLFFIEIKYYNKSHGRLGFGHQKGAGFQPEVLSKRPDYFEKNMRWILGSKDSNKYYFLNNSQIAQYISGGEIDYKQNNIQTIIFSDIGGLKRSELSNELLKWFNE